MATATWNGVVLAESDDTVVVEGNHYFPIDAVNLDYFTQSEARTVCPWKGVASYYDIEVEGQVNEGAAFFYREPKPAAADIRDRVAFWKGVAVST